MLEQEILHITGQYDPECVTSISLPGRKLTSLSFLQAYPNLIYLDISRNEIKDLTPLVFIHGLKFFVADFNNINNLSGIEICEKLENLSMVGNPLATGTDIQPLSSLTNLRHLQFRSKSEQSACPICSSPNYRAIITTLTNHSGKQNLRTLDGLILGLENLPDVTQVQNQLYQSILKSYQYKQWVGGSSFAFRPDLLAQPAGFLQTQIEDAKEELGKMKYMAPQLTQIQQQIQVQPKQQGKKHGSK
ncbi:MAG: hypothetical protein EZS28_013062 [Streblomastix strix]|uniref:Uncharacterized protein n=1 Tax=Streblomastix strix TaxID=222440 RepID=A0A5J4W8Z8_9EUKA|nr:MAG: hypothetical protein EZS28_013062 [Streblomastix strix]